MGTKWNGEPCVCRKVKVIVGPAEKPTYWYAGMEGTTRVAVEVTQDGHTFFLDDEDGSGSKKVLIGHGMWTSPHKSLAVKEVVEVIGVIQ